MLKENCIEFCPKYKICQKLAEKGEAAILQVALSGYSASDAEFLTEDGRYIAGWQMEKTIPQEVADDLLDAGNDLIESGRKLGDLLLQGCTEGPRQLSSDEDRYLCRSINSNIGISQEDIDAAG